MLSHRPVRVRHNDDGREEQNVTVNGQKFLAEQFEARRPLLRSVAYRMLGSGSEADDAVQETWLRLSRTEDCGIQNLGAWLRTVVARVCLDMLRSRRSRREEPITPEIPEPISAGAEEETLFSDSVSMAVLLVLETLEPAERIAFVLHDMFGVPFDEIAPIVGRSNPATRQLASRARRRVRGASIDMSKEFGPQKAVVDAFIDASRSGNLEALLAVLDPQVVFQADKAAVQLGSPAELHGASDVAQIFRGRAKAARPALIDGTAGLAVLRGEAIFLLVRLSITNGRIVKISAVADPEHISTLDVSILDP
jgi:RNA polymerase sigma-70 factor (ECF subfamily)